MDPFDKRLLFVTGKGGVGKTTVAYALGLAAAAAGKRAIVCEIASQERGADLFARKPIGFEETRLAKGLWALSVDPDELVHEYLQTHMPVRAMAELLHRSRLFTYLAAATPGLAEMVTMGKVWELAQKPRKAPGRSRTYDVVIVDAPATGHGVGLLRTPRTFREIARVGPLANQARRIEETLTDPRMTAITIVARAEEMAVNESIGLEETLTGVPEGAFSVDRVYVNGLYPRRFSDAERTKLEALSSTVGDGPAGAALSAATAEVARVAAQGAQLDRLRAGVKAPVVELPFLFAPKIGRAELDLLAEALT